MKHLVLIAAIVFALFAGASAIDTLGIAQASPGIATYMDGDGGGGQPGKTLLASCGTFDGRNACFAWFSDGSWSEWFSCPDYDPLCDAYKW